MRDTWDVLLVAMAAAGIGMMVASVFFDASILRYGWLLTGIGGPGLLLRSRVS